MASPMFACIVPGRPLMAEFETVSETKLVIRLDHPAQITNFVITLLQPHIQPNFGVGVYYITPDSPEWNYVGCISLASPSGFFRAPWNVCNSPAQIQYPFVHIGLALQPLTELEEKITSDQIAESKTFDNARAIATDLYTFIQSFSHIPNNVIDRWMQKFEEKHRREPFFWMK